MKKVGLKDSGFLEEKTMLNESLSFKHAKSLVGKLIVAVWVS